VEDGAPRLAGMGDYTDICRRCEDGEWRIASRYISNVHSITAKADESRNKPS